MLISSDVCLYMDGRYFEEFVAEIYNLKGYSYELTNNTGDQGLDIILYKDDEKVGVQCKRFTGKVGNKAVQEAFAGKYFYECDKAVVVTPSTFTKSARDLASKLQVTLVDKNELDSILSNLQEYLLNNFFKHEKITEILINSSIDISRNGHIDYSIKILSHLKTYLYFIKESLAVLLYNNLGLSHSWKNEKEIAINIYLEGIKTLQNLSHEDKISLFNNCLVSYRDINSKEEAFVLLNSIHFDELSPSNIELLKTREQEILSLKS